MKHRMDLLDNLLVNNENSVGKVLGRMSNTDKVIIAQGYGVNRQTPVRFLAYAVPVLRLASQLKNIAIVEFYFATHGVARANGQVHDKSTEMMQNILSKYVQTFYPDLVSQVRILTDKPLNASAKALISELLPLAKIVVESCPAIKQFVDNRLGEETLRYMIEHLLYMRDPLLFKGGPVKELVVPEMETHIDHIVMVGGHAEKIFWRFRKEMLKLSGQHTQWESHQFFTTIGDPPTYHYQKGEPIVGDSPHDNVDLLFERINSLDGVWGKRNMIRDYKFLLQDFAKVEKFESQGNINMDILKVGYTKLKEFIRNF